MKGKMNFDITSSKISNCSKLSYSKSLQVAEVVLGEHDLSNDPDCRGCLPIQRFEIHPNDVTPHENFDYKNMFVNSSDIAIIKLPRNALTVVKNQDMLVLPICLPSNEEEVLNADEYWVKV